MLFGLPSLLVWGAVVAFLSLVPVVGTALVWAPLVIYCVLTGAVWKGIILRAICVVEVATVDNLVKPIFMRRGYEVGRHASGSGRRKFRRR
ncbi:MAG: AI-2E family transporter [Terriglobia bacterium]